jgi:hypothetical protein
MDYAAVIWHRPEDKTAPTTQQLNKILDSAATSHESNNRMFPNDTNGGTRK